MLLTLLFAFSCNTKNSGAGNRQATETALHIYIFDVGEILVNDISTLNAGPGEKTPVRMTNSAYLIRHPLGDLIWDTGFHDSTISNPLGTPESAFYSTMSKTLAAQLEEIGITPKEVDFLAVSHLHPDHTGNMGLFAEATLVVQQEEHDSLLYSSQYNMADVLKENKKMRLRGDLDLFGDGSVVIKRATGHTAGHQVLYVDLPETGPVVLSGDLWLFAEDRASRGVPWFNVNRDSTLASWFAISNFIEEREATLWVQHDYKQMMALPHAPEAIR